MIQVNPYNIFFCKRHPISDSISIKIWHFVKIYSIRILGYCSLWKIQTSLKKSFINRILLKIQWRKTNFQNWVHGTYNRFSILNRDWIRSYAPYYCNILYTIPIEVSQIWAVFLWFYWKTLKILNLISKSINTKYPCSVSNIFWDLFLNESCLSCVLLDNLISNPVKYLGSFVQIWLNFLINLLFKIIRILLNLNIVRVYFSFQLI